VLQPSAQSSAECFTLPDKSPRAVCQQMRECAPRA